MKAATVCTGIGSPEKALRNLGIHHEIVFGCEIDKYARQTYLANFNPGFMEPDMTKCDWIGEQYYADLFIGGIPCQAFSLAGKRLGELDPRGLLFFDFYRYVKNQKPKYFIIENVKGLLSDNAGATFQNWINLLGQSVNGDQFMFPHEDSLMYNLHWQVLNTKDYGLPQNRERVFLIGIRNDLPNSFVFPKGVPLKLRLKDILEPEVDEKYYLSDEIIDKVLNNQSGQKNFDKVIQLNPSTESGGVQPYQHNRVYDSNGLMTTLDTDSGRKNILIKSATSSAYETAEPTILSTNMAGQTFENDYCGTLRAGASANYQLVKIPEFKIGAMRGRNPENQSDRTPGAPTQQMLEINENGTSNCLTSVQKDNLVVEHKSIQILDDYNGNILKGEIIGTLTQNSGNSAPRNGFKIIENGYSIRKLTPKECFRLQGFPDEFLQNALDAGVSNSQLYKQAGNSISVPVIQAILKNLI